MGIVRFKHNFLWLEILPRKLSLVSENNDLERFLSTSFFLLVDLKLRLQLQTNSNVNSFREFVVEKFFLD